MPLALRDRLLLAAVIIINLVAKLLWLGVNELGHDEPFTVFWSQRPLDELWAMLRTENNPPLYFLLIKVWSSWVPFEAAWLRVPSAVASAFTVWPLFLIAHRLGGTRPAVIAAVLFTASGYHYGFAHEVRAYALFTLLTVTGMWLLLRASDRPRPLRAMMVLALLNTVMVYTHFFGWLVVGLQAIIVLALPLLRPLREAFLRSALITLGAFVPYLAVFATRLGQSVSQGTWLEPPQPEELYNMVWRWSNVPVLAVALIALITAAAWKDRWRTSGFQFALLWTFVPLLGMFGVSYAVPMFLDRYLVYAAPGFVLLAALSVGSLFRNDGQRHVVATGLCLGMVGTFSPWKDTGPHPSRVLQVEQDLCADQCAVEVIPRWYWLTHLAAKDIHSLRRPTDQHMAYSTHPVGQGDARTPSPPTDTFATAVVVDAGAHLVDPGRRWYKDLRATHPVVDSVEADHKVWVYRFRR